jgi:colicin import membrane protein
LLVHLLVLLVFTVAWLWSPERSTEAAAGNPSLEASLDVSAADARVARQALKAEAQPFTPPAPVPEAAPEDTVPPPQPIPEPRPQDAPTPQQANAQERIAQPDTVDQEQVSALAESQEKAKQEQEAKRRQAQVDLTERKRQDEAEQARRLAKQQQDDAEKKKIADQQAQAQVDRDKKLAELRKQREQLEAQMARDAKQADLAEQKLRQLAASRAQQASSGATAPSAAAAPGAGGTSNDLSAKYAAAIQQAVLAQWIRPDSVPLGQKCTIHIRQVPGGTVIQAEVAPNCPFDDAGKRSIEAAVLRAQPLPYRGFESVFARDLNFNFTAQDR